MSSGVIYRLFGLGCLALAGAVGWWGIWRPWQAALGHAPEVEYSLKVFVLVPAAAVFGLFFTLFGDSVAYRTVSEDDRRSPRFTAAGWLLMLAVAGASLGGFWWLKDQFAAMGYENASARP